MTDLAERVGLSATPCTERVRRLEKAGVIQGYYARLDPKAMDLPLLVFVEIKLSTKSGEIFEAFRREVLTLPHVLDCHLVSGDFDYLIKPRGNKQKVIVFFSKDCRDKREAYRSAYGGD
jgi:Lrp/AsnC family leucine-responsive transcriptional regulator